MNIEREEDTFSVIDSVEIKKEVEECEIYSYEYVDCYKKEIKSEDEMSDDTSKPIPQFVPSINTLLQDEPVFSVKETQDVEKNTNIDQCARDYDGARVEEEMTEQTTKSILIKDADNHTNEITTFECSFPVHILLSTRNLKMWKLVLLAVSAGIYADQSCPSKYNGIKLSIKSETNATGHWNAQIGTEHSESVPWELDLQHLSEQCGHYNLVQVLASISVPLQGTIMQMPGYELIPGLGYYKFHPEPKTWFVAQDTCVQEGAHLVVINSQREANALLHFWVPYPRTYTDWKNEWAHVGFHDLYVEGEYVTIFGESLNASGYEKWYPGKPNKGPAINCGAATRAASLLSDVYCTSEFAFFCEKEL